MHTFLPQAAYTLAAKLTSRAPSQYIWLIIVDSLDAEIEH